MIVSPRRSLGDTGDFKVIRLKVSRFTSIGVLTAVAGAERLAAEPRRDDGDLHSLAPHIPAVGSSG